MENPYEPPQHEPIPGHIPRPRPSGWFGRWCLFNLVLAPAVFALFVFLVRSNDLAVYVFAALIMFLAGGANAWAHANGTGGTKTLIAIACVMLQGVVCLIAFFGTCLVMISIMRR